MFVCEVCQKEFENKSDLVQHQKIKNHLFDCPDCKRSFTSKRALEQHQKIKHLPSVCEICGKEFKKQKSLEQHMANKHYTQQCAKCKKKFLTKENLDKHYHSKHLIICKYCGEEFDEDKIKKHLRKMHNVCPCGEKFETRAELYAHIDHVHSKVPVYTVNSEHHEFDLEEILAKEKYYKVR